ncbi:MAG: class I SAM-dependent methyltransferase [Parachlamydiaceae bacterium]|nr:class I SAM-dependent methyltransferase [Parachlamydiaceae bacterium]
MKSKRSPKLDLETIMPLLIGVWRRYTKLSGPPDVLQTREFRGVVAAVEEMQKGLESGDQLIGQDYFSVPELLGAYILYQWVIHYQEAMSLIGELPSAPRRVLDICSGPAPYSFAALHHGAQEVIALDQNLKAMTLGSEICGRYGFPLSIRTHNCRNARLPVEGKFDLIVVAHALEELFPETQKNWQLTQKAWIDQILTYLNPEGQLLLVGSSQTLANKRYLILRDTLVKQGIAVQAPCVWKGECPALQTKNSPCYAQRPFEKPYLIKQIQRGAQINLSSLKMSYLLMRSPGAEWPVLPPRPLYRVISPPVESNLGKSFYLCGTDGKKSISSNLKEHPIESRAFEYLKRGELISVEDFIDRQSRFEITTGTRIRVEAALGKPLPHPAGVIEEEF